MVPLHDSRQHLSDASCSKKVDTVERLCLGRGMRGRRQRITVLMTHTEAHKSARHITVSAHAWYEPQRCRRYGRAVGRYRKQVYCRWCRRLVRSVGNCRVVSVHTNTPCTSPWRLIGRPTTAWAGMGGGGGGAADWQCSHFRSEVAKQGLYLLFR